MLLPGTGMAKNPVKNTINKSSLRIPEDFILSNKLNHSAAHLQTKQIHRLFRAQKNPTFGKVG
jgi:hypothetical protein